MSLQSQSARLAITKGLKNKSQYQQYQDGLENYKNRSRSKLQLDQWNLIQSRLMSPMGNKQVLKNKDKNNIISIQKGDALSQYQGRRDIGTGSNYQQNHTGKQPQSSRVSSNKDKGEHNGSYTEKIRLQFENSNSQSKSNDQLQKQLKSMRYLLQQLNNMVNMKLNKYQIAQFVPKGMAVVNQPQKQQEVIMAKIEINSKIIESLQKQIRQVQLRDKDLQEKDYLIQLQDSTNQVLKEIREKRKVKHQQGVAVDKLDSKLLQMRQNALDDQFKMVKVIKHNSLYYFKKYNQNKTLLEELDKNYEDLVQKDKKISQKYAQYTKIAQQKNMLVKANRNYIQIKKVNDQLVAKVEQMKKKLDIAKRSKQTQAQKIIKQNDRTRRQILQFQSIIQQFSIRNQDVLKNTESYVQKNKVDPKFISKVNQKFTQVLLKDEDNPDTQRDNSQLDSQNHAAHQIKKSLLLKPKLSLSKRYSPKLNQKYHTLSLQKSSISKLNDKNQTINFEDDPKKGKQFRIKPSMLIKKRGNTQDKLMKSIDVPDQANNAEKTEEVSFAKKIMGIISKKN